MRAVIGKVMGKVMSKVVSVCVPARVCVCVRVCVVLGYIWMHCFTGMGMDAYGCIGLYVRFTARITLTHHPWWVI